MTNLHFVDDINELAGNEQKNSNRVHKQSICSIHLQILRQLVTDEESRPALQREEKKRGR